VESRPRMQSRPIVIPLAQGDAGVHPGARSPGVSSRGWSKAIVRHGVAEIRSGRTPERSRRDISLMRA